MKKGILTKLGLLMVASFMVTGCGPQPAPVPSSSAPSSSEEPLPPEDEHVDLTYPLEETEINEISDEDFEETILAATGSKNMYETIRMRLGDYFYDFLRTHNHMTNEEFCYFMSLVNGISNAVDNDNLDYHEFYNVLYAIAYINTDHLYSTIQELRDDGTAWGYFINVMQGRYFSNDYINVDYVAGGRSSVHALAEEEKSLLAGNPYALQCWTDTYFLEDLFAPELGPVALRFVHRFARSMIRNLSTEEVGFVLYMTVLDRFKETDAAQDVIEEVSENLLDFVHHVGAWLTELDINAATYGALYPLFDIVYQQSFFGDFEMQASYFIESEWYERAQNSLRNLLKDANPEGLRVLFKFLGLLASNMDQTTLDMFFVEEMEDFDGQVIVDYYNEQYGLLEGEEKAAFTEFFAAFGIDFDEFIERLKEAVIDPDGRAHTRESDEEESIFNQILNECVVYPFLENFEMEYPDYYSKYRDSDYVPVLREGTNFTAEDFEEYLQSPETPLIGIRSDLIEDDGRAVRGDEIGDYIYENNDYRKARTYRELVESEQFDTSTSGVKEVKFTVETVISIYDHWDSETEQTVYIDYPITANLTMRYMVVPADVEGIHTNDNEMGVFTGNDWSVDSERVLFDKNGNPYFFDYDALYVLQDKDYAENDVYLSLHGIDNGRGFDASANRYIEYDEQYLSDKTIINESCEKIYLNVLDTAELGVHYVTATVTYTRAESYEEEFVTFATEKVNMKYIVVESLEQIPGVDISTPIK